MNECFLPYFNLNLQPLSINYTADCQLNTGLEFVLYKNTSASQEKQPEHLWLITSFNTHSPFLFQSA